MARAQIRRATQGDLEAIYRLLLVMHKENGLAPLDALKTRVTIHRTLKDGTVLIAERDGEIVGSIGLYRDAPWYSKTPMLMDHWTFVHPKHRRSRTAIELIQAAREAAKTAGLRLFLGINTPVKLEAKSRFYRALGFEAVAVLMIDKKGR